MSLVFTSDVFQQLSSEMDQKREEWGVPGCAIGIVSGEKVIFSKGLGTSRLGEDTAVTVETLFPIASATKSFTAMCLALLVEDGKLEWDTPICEYWPEFQLYDPLATARITTRDLLCHRSGLPRHDLVWYNTSLTREQLMKRLSYLEPTVDFRYSYQYQNLMYTAAGHLVERLSGTSWEAFVKERMLNPLQMNHTHFSVLAAQQTGSVAKPYMMKAGCAVEMPYLNNEAIGPAGSMISSLEDMTKWLSYHIQGVLPDGQPLVAPHLLKEMYTPQIVSTPQTPYPEIPFVCSAMGWFVQSYRGHKMIFHAGNIQGFSSLVSFLPDLGLGIVVLSQVDQSRLPAAITYDVYDRLLGLAPSDWYGRLKKEALLETEQMEKQVQCLKESIRITHLDSTPLTSYAGEYHHPGYGSITIANLGSSLQMFYNGLCFQLDQTGERTFLGVYDGTYSLYLPLTFQLDQDNHIIHLSAKLEPAAKANEIVFTRLKHSFY